MLKGIKNEENARRWQGVEEMTVTVYEPLKRKAQRIDCWSFLFTHIFIQSVLPLVVMHFQKLVYHSVKLIAIILIFQWRRPEYLVKTKLSSINQSICIILYSVIYIHYNILSMIRHKLGLYQRWTISVRWYNP